MRISATIISLNEAENIRAAIESVSWADEIVVVDSGSTDATVGIAKECGARVLHHAWPGFARQKQFAADAAANDWIFSLDADERVSSDLASSVNQLRAKTNLADGYRVARRAFYQGRWIRGGGWYPDYQLRLFNRQHGQWGDRIIHESVVMNQGARVETLSGDILHYSMRDPEHHRHMIEERYAPLGAEQMLSEGKRTSRWQMKLVGPMTFVRSYALKGGFRDGRAGLTIAKLAAYHAKLKHSILFELQNKK